ncbi:MAG: hypothetical protein ACRC6H_02950 [Culicoidibacterales bacterium]
MKNITTITGLGILALSIVATTITNSIYLVGVFLIASFCALGIRQVNKKWHLSTFVSVTILVALLTIIRLGLSVLEPALANHVVMIALPFQPLLIAMVIPSEWEATTFTWLKACFTTASALIIISVIAELLATGMIFGYPLDFIQASSFFQTSGGIFLITAVVLAITQIWKRGERA